MRKFKCDYNIIEYITIALLTLSVIAIYISYYESYNILTLNFPPFKLYLVAIIDIIFMVVVSLLFSNVEFRIGKYEEIFIMLIIVEIISVINSINVEVSIWGDTSFREGILTLLSYYTFFYLARFLKSDESKHLLVKVFLFLGSTHCLYGLCKYFGIITGSIHAPYHDLRMISGLIWHPNYMGTLTVIVSGVCAGYFYFSNTLKKNLLYLFILVFFLLTALLTKTMSTYFGIVMMVIAFLAYIYITRNKHIQFENRKIKPIYILVVSLILAIIVLIYVDVYLTDNYISSEIGNVIAQLMYIIKHKEIQPNFGGGRFKVWQLLLKLLPSYWITGTGIDTVYDALKYYYGIGMIDRNLGKAYNEYLQVLITMGLPALVLYLTFYYFIIKDIVARLVNINRHKASWKEEPLYVGLWLCVVGYLCQAFFNISVIFAAPYFWILMGISSESMITVHSNEDNDSNNKILLVYIVCLSIFLLWIIDSIAHLFYRIY